MKRDLLTCCIAKWLLADLAIAISYFLKALFSHLFGAATAFGLNSCALCFPTDHATDEWPPLRQADGARRCRSKLHLLKHSQQRPRPAAPSPRGVPGEREGESRAEGARETPSIPASPGSQWELKSGAFQNGLLYTIMVIPDGERWEAWALFSSALLM